MANLKEVRTRIASVISTQQITKAMKMVSASKLRRAQNAIVRIRPYAGKLQEIIGNVQGNLEGDISLNLGEIRPVKNVLVVVLTSDKGLCGGFNSNLIKKAKALIADKYAEQQVADNLTIMTIGKKGLEHFQNRGYQVDDRYFDLFTKLKFENVSPIVEEIIENFEDKKYDAVEVIYAKFKNAVVQDFTAEQLLPIAGNATEMEETAGNNINYIFEPSQEEIIQNIIPSYLKIQFYRYLLDNHASEHGARMTSMDQATENAGDLLKELRLEYNRVRQAAITTEISEIVGGVAALDG